MSITFDRMLELVDGRSAALRSSLAGALGERVPGAPDWTGRDLLAHLGEVQRFWAAVVVAGKPDGPPDDADVPEREPAGDLLDWSERSTAALLDALRAAGPDRPVWSWWGPTTAGRVARHQVQEAGVHAWDADDTIGRAGPLLPAELAADGVDEFLSVEVPTNGGWPHPPATGGAGAPGEPDGWRVVLGAGGGRVERGPASDDAVVGGGADVAGGAVLDGGAGAALGGGADVVLGGGAGELVLALYGRRPVGSLTVTGDEEVARRFLDWFTTE